MRKIVIAGANGMLGRDVAQALKRFSPVCVDLPELDITSFGDTMQFISAQKPDVVINCAAYTDVDGCETNKDLAFRVNGMGVRNLAIASEKAGAELVHISSDYVFDGEKGAPYIECDTTNPTSVYGWSKLMGERELMSHTRKFYLLRTQWLYGLNGKSFVKTMLSLAAQNKPISVVDDQIGSPTYSPDLAGLIARLIETGQYGLYHTTNSGTVSWYQFAKEIFDATGVSVDLKPIKSEQYPRPAKRPKFSKLDNLALRLSGFPELRDYKEALVQYLASVKH